MYGIYKNGYLLFQHDLINFFSIFKVLYLVMISISIKFIIDIIKHKKILFDYNLVSVILVALIVPYNINILLYTIVVLITYLISLLINKYLLVNPVCLIYLVLLLTISITSNITYLTPLDMNYQFKYSFIDYFLGKGVGGIASSSIILSLLAYTYLINNPYYKKDIPLFINISYLIPAFIYFFITMDSSYLLNGELIFASIFVAPIPIYSPYLKKFQIIYACFIGILTFILSLIFNIIYAVYIAILVTFLLNLLNVRHK